MDCPLPLWKFDVDGVQCGDILARRAKSSGRAGKVRVCLCDKYRPNDTLDSSRQRRAAVG
jgi:hypothetical protein